MTDRHCRNCDKLVEPYVNYVCSWACMIEIAKKAGGRVFTPNGLPIGSIKANNDMYEHEHGDHPTYKFPVDVEYIGIIDDEDREEFMNVTSNSDPVVFSEAVDSEAFHAAVRKYKGEIHALIYNDDSIALTLWECEYFMWGLRDGRPVSVMRPRYGDYRLTETSIQRILAGHY